MNYSYTMTGGISVGGCAHVKTSNVYVFKYAPGTVVYACFEARKGILEAVVIKDIKLIKNRRTYGKIVPFYYDRNNAVYMEHELCTKDGAVALATAFYEEQMRQVNELLSKCPNGG